MILSALHFWALPGEGRRNLVIFSCNDVVFDVNVLSVLVAIESKYLLLFQSTEEANKICIQYDPVMDIEAPR